MTDYDFSLNSINASSLYFETGRYLDELMPGQMELIIDIAKKSGLQQATKKFINRPIPVYGILYGTSSANLDTRIQAFADFLYSDNDVPLIFNNKSDRYYNAQFLIKVSTIKKGGGYFAPYEIVFNCNDPFAYALTPTTDHQDVTVNDTTKVIANGGHFYALPTITITFNQAQTHIYIENNGIPNNRLDISKAFNIADELEINCKDGTVKLNSSVSMAGFGDGGESLAEWILLAAGNNELQVGTDDATIDVDVDISFEKVYFN